MVHHPFNPLLTVIWQNLVLTCHTTRGGNDNTENMKFVVNKKRGITINGVDMQEYMKLKSQEAAKNTPTRKYNKNKGTKKEQLSTPSIGLKNKILQYVTKKKAAGDDDNNRNKKPTSRFLVV